MAKVQGEGDYESARRYNARTRRFVEGSRGAQKRAEGGVDESALRKAKSKSRADGQDNRDARVFRELVTSPKRRKSSASRASTHR